MSTLLVLTTGQTDVQLVEGDARRELDKENCAALHDEIERRANDWLLVDSPAPKRWPAAESLPAGSIKLCTPKLDAVMQYLQDRGITLTAALILETRRDARAERGDPRFAGEIIATRLRERGVTDVLQVAFLSDRERLEDREQPRDAIIRRTIVHRIDQAVRDRLKTIDPARVVLATTGGIPPLNSLIEEVVRLYAPPCAEVDSLEVADGAKALPPTNDRAVSRHWVPEPAASYQARRHALELIAKGNLLGAWGAVQHLHDDELERQWTRVIEWLAAFAASLPIPDECDIDLLKHPRMAVRAGLRVELALLAGDIPRAVHGTVAFFESALWDHLGPHLTPIDDSKGRRLFNVTPEPDEQFVRRGDGSQDDRRRPFEAEDINGVRWYKVFDDDVCGIRLAKHYLQQLPLEKLGQAVSKVRELRNDVAHNEPTPQLMDDARRRMADAQLWSTNGTFLTQPLVQDVLRDLGENDPAHLCTDLMEAIRARLLGLQEQP